MAPTESGPLKVLLRELSPKVATIVSIADQASSSITNFGVVIIAARMLGAGEFGLFSLIYGIYILIVSGAQSFIGQALVLEQGSRKKLEVESARALKLSLELGVGVGVVLIPLGLIIPSLGFPLVVLGVLMPLLLIQDAARFCVSLLRAPAYALVSDLLWIFFLMVSTVVLLKEDSGSASAVQITLAWATSGAVSGLSGCVLMHGWARGEHLDLRDFLRFGYLGQRFLAEFAVIRGVGQILSISIGALVSIAAAGAYRAAMTLYGPLNVLINAINAFAIPLLRRSCLVKRERAFIGIALLLVLIAAGGTLLLIEMPSSWGNAIFGESWVGARELIMPFGAQAIGISVNTVAFIAIRMISPTLTLRLRVVTAFLQIIGFFLGIWIADITGAAWGIAFAAIAQAILAIIQYLQIRGTQNQEVQGAEE